MRISVIGAGAAGLTAAFRLQQAGHAVTVFEAQPHVGGRTHSEHFGPGHHIDTGAGWLTSAYTRTLALFDEIGEQRRLVPMHASGPSELLVDGRSYSGNGAPRTPGDSPLLPDDDRARLADWARGLKDYPPLGYELRADGESAADHMAAVSPAAARYIFAPMFEGLFAPLEEQSAEFLRSWAAAGRATYWQVEGGMDAPWKAIAACLADVRTGLRVHRVEAAGGSLQLIAGDRAEQFDGAVLAMPPPQSGGMLPIEFEPHWYRGIEYVGQCRLYLAMPGDAPAAYHRRPLPMGVLASVEWQSARDGAWGACPDGWQWALICANEAHNAELLPLDDDRLVARLMDAARRIVPQLPHIDAWAVRHLIRWERAVPTMAPGHFTRMAAYDRRPPVVFAGDWTHQACVEGAVRSGEAAAAAFGSA